MGPEKDGGLVQMAGPLSPGSSSWSHTVSGRNQSDQDSARCSPAELSYIPSASPTLVTRVSPRKGWGESMGLGVKVPPSSASSRSPVCKMKVIMTSTSQDRVNTYRVGTQPVQVVPGWGHNASS